MAHEKRWMIFVDGENFTIQAQKFAGEKGYPLKDGQYWKKNIFLWIPDSLGSDNVCKSGSLFNALVTHYPVESVGIRAYYYTAMSGDEGQVTMVKTTIKRLGFEPKVFKKLAPNRRALISRFHATCFPMLFGIIMILLY